jgi:hypothetical protein
LGSSISFEFFEQVFNQYTIKPLYLSEIVAPTMYIATAIMKGDTSQTVWVFATDGSTGFVRTAGTYVPDSHTTTYSVTWTKLPLPSIIYCYMSTDQYFSTTVPMVADSVVYLWSKSIADANMIVRHPIILPAANAEMRFDVNGNAVAAPDLAENAWFDTGIMSGTKKVWKYHGVTTSAPTRDADITLVSLPVIQDFFGITGFLYSNNNNMKYPINFYRPASGQSIYTYVTGAGAVMMGWHTNDTADNTFASRTMRWVLTCTRTDA